MKKTDWTRAACYRHEDPDLWFTAGSEDCAVQVCGACPLRQECLIIALERPEKHGVWGGFTEDQRRRFKFKKNRVRCPGCTATDVDQRVSGVEVCRSCGLSWRV